LLAKGAQMHSCSSPVRMEQATEQVSSMNAAFSTLIDESQSGGRVRRLELQSPVRPVPVVMLDIDSEDLLEVPATHDEQPVKALGPHRPDPALGVGVGVRRLNWRDQHLGAVRAEHVVEPAAELRVTIANKETHPASSFLEDKQQVAACWVTQVPLGLAVTPARWTRRVSSSMKNSTYNRRTQTVSTVKKSQATIPAACWRRNARQVVVGSRPWRCSVVRIAVAEIRTPRCSSSPWMRW
jgi:hypothetical protein